MDSIGIPLLFVFQSHFSSATITKISCEFITYGVTLQSQLFSIMEAKYTEIFVCHLINSLHIYLLK